MKNIIKTSSPLSRRQLLVTVMLSFLMSTAQAQASCSSTADCEADVEYCSNGNCARIGYCQKDVDCFNQENSFSVDSCIGYLECSKDNQCVKTCSDTFCKPDSNVNDLFCPTVMCDINNCDGAVSCVNYNCYDCEVIYFDAQGTQICNEDKKDEPITCSSNEDCRIDIGDVVNIMAVEDQPYCAGGTCALPGTCATDLDCINPSNHYGVIECAGPIVCQQGQCTRDCSTGSMCKEGVDQTYCFVNPCDVSPGCAESTGCVADYCSGGCDAIHFDAAGNVLEECDGKFVIPDSCTQDKDCNDGEGMPTHYCSSGTCKAMGTCDEMTDCLNPSNEVGFITCTGYRQCTTDGECEQVCSEEEHCCFIPVECTAGDKEACPDAVTCVKDNCNDSGDHCGAGTGSFFFDSSSQSICEKDAPSPTMAPNSKVANGGDNDLADGAKMIGITLSMMIAIIATLML